MPSQLISVVVPVYNEAGNIEPCLRGLWSVLEGIEHEILVCYDFEEDDTLPAIAAMPDAPPSVRLVKNDLGRGAAFALRAGFAAAAGDVAWGLRSIALALDDESLADAALHTYVARAHAHGWYEAAWRRCEAELHRRPNSTAVHQTAGWLLRSFSSSARIWRIWKPVRRPNSTGSRWR